MGRTVRWTAAWIEYEADVGHRKKLMEAERLEEDSKVVAGPAVKMDDERDKLDLEELEVDKRKEFRGMAARMNYLGQDRSDIQFWG